MGEKHELKLKSLFYFKYPCFVVVAQGRGVGIGVGWLILRRSVKLYFTETGKEHSK